MTPVTPARRPGSIAIVFGRNQPQYKPLPANSDGDCVETKWVLSWRERFRVLCGAALYIKVLTFGKKLQPIKPTIGQDPR